MTYNMRPSRVLKKMREGKVATAIKLNYYDIRNAELAAMSGYDCLWLDMEHVPNGMRDIEDAVRAAKIYDVDTLTRVSRGGYSDYIRPLEADSTGIMVPHLMSAKDADYVRYYTKFFPIGRRPLDGGNADGKYCLVEPLDYMEQANRERFTVIQIEDPEGLAEIEEIAATPGIDMLFFGPADFSQGAGIPCQWDNPLLDETRRKVAYVARKHGKFAGTVGGPETYDRLVDMGYQFINMGADVEILCKYYVEIAQSIKERNAVAFEDIK